MIVPGGGGGVSLQPLLPSDPGILGRHRVLGRLGSGGMGVVYLADGPLGWVAVKLIRAELADDAEFRARFQREVQACFRVRGAHTARLVDFELDAERPWLATEFVDSADLATRVDADGPFAADEQVRLAPGPRAGHPGLALARAGCRVKRITSPLATDVFAWGGLVAFAATGERPFGTGTPEAVLHRVLVAEPAIDEDRIAPTLRPLVRRALSRQAQDRPLAQELCDELEPAGSDEAGTAILADPLGSTRRLAGAPPGAETAGGDGGAGASVAPRPGPRVGDRLRRPGLLYAAGAAAVVVVAGALAGVLLLGGNDSGDGTGGPDALSAGPEQPTERDGVDFTATSPWRIVIRDMIEGEDNGCTVTVTNIETGEQATITDSFGTTSFQVHDTGSFRWRPTIRAALWSGAPALGRHCCPSRSRPAPVTPMRSPPRPGSPLRLWTSTAAPSATSCFTTPSTAVFWTSARCTTAAARCYWTRTVAPRSTSPTCNAGCACPTLPADHAGHLIAHHSNRIRQRRRQPGLGRNPRKVTRDQIAFFVFSAVIRSSSLRSVSSAT